jgi:hypothetical protein
VTASSLFEAAKSKAASAVSVPQPTTSSSVTQSSSPAPLIVPISKLKRVFPCNEEITIPTSDGSSSSVSVHSCTLELVSDSVSVITEFSSRTITKTVKVRSLEKVSTSKKRPERLALVFSKPPIVVIADENEDESGSGKEQTGLVAGDTNNGRVVLIFATGDEASAFLSELQESASQ